MDLKVQNASDYGVLQNRQRVIIVGWKKFDVDGNPTSFKYPELEKEENHYRVLKDLFADLPKRKSGEGGFCEPVGYTKDLSEMKYLQESGIRGTFDFTTHHVARPNNAKTVNL
jgi:DNA (cytosine-5)-methyltransferase 1